MHVLVTRRRHLGQALDQDAVRKAVPVRGDVEVRCENAVCLGRTSMVAKVRPVDPLGPPPLPPLVDVSLSWVATNGFILGGVEEVGGIMYAQSWWCRLD